MRTARCLLLLLLLAAPVGCQNSLRALAKGATGQLDPPDIAPKHTAAAEAPPEEATLTDADPGLDNFRAGLKQYAERQQELFSGSNASPPPTTQPTVSQAAATQTAETSSASREQAFQRVLDDLQEIGRESPTAQQHLLAQLRSTDPAFWEALAQRTKSELRYHQELVAGPKPEGNQRVASLPGSRAGAESPQSEPATMMYPQTQPAAAEQGSREPAQTAPAQSTQQSAAELRRVDPSIKAASATMVFPAPDASIAAAPNQPAGDLGGQSWEASLHRAIEGLSAELSTHPQTTGEAYSHVRLRLLQLAAGNLSDAAEAAPGLTATEQQYWSNQLLAISTLLDHQTQIDARRRAAAGGVHLKRAVDALDELGSLTVSNVVFCDTIYGFGAYKPVAKSHFRPGQEVKLYAEIENFKTISTPQGEHTSLATSYKVLDQHGGLVDSGEVPVVNDYCAQRRRDFHIEYTLTLPQRVYPGAYVLELTLTDQLGDKIGHGSIQFDIATE
ncbi:MAG: hypothetical protein KDA37_09100 [Planctomycetales bacterium]|nr:hypothetical protein [Planctomycetales bacterium]